MSKSFVVTHRDRPRLIFTFGVDTLFLDIINAMHVDLSELSQEELEVFLGTLSVLHPKISLKSAPPSGYVLRYI